MASPPLNTTCRTDSGLSSPAICSTSSIFMLRRGLRQMSQVTQRLSGQVNGEQATVASARAQITTAKAQVDASRVEVANKQWDLDQTTTYAPADGTIVNLQLRVGQVASQIVTAPVMTFIENGQWVVAMFRQNEVREVLPGQEAEIAMQMYPGQIIKCTVDSVVWATAGGQVPVGGNLPTIGPMPPGQLVVRLLPVDKGIFLAAGARGAGAIYTEYAEMIHIVRKVIMRVGAKLDWLILKLH